MKEHNLKIDVMHLAQLVSGTKKAELRNNDRNFQLGDVLLFEHYGIILKFKITHIADFPDALKEGYVCLSVAMLTNWAVKPQV